MTEQHSEGCDVLIRRDCKKAQLPGSSASRAERPGSSADGLGRLRSTSHRLAEPHSGGRCGEDFIQLLAIDRFQQVQVKTGLQGALVILFLSPSGKGDQQHRLTTGR
jgi:hypothetical protein